MKPFQIVSVAALIVSFLIVSPSSYASVQFYGAEADLDSSGNAKISLTITFDKPVKGFQLAVFGNVKNFAAVSNAGPVDCKIEAGAASIIDCKMNITQEKRTLELSFETPDLVKKINGKNIFSLDLSLSQNISQASTSIKLPEGYALANTSIPEVSPPTDHIVSDGRRIIVNWNLANLTADSSFKFQTLYEPVQSGFLTGFFISSAPGMATLGVLSVFALGGSLLLYRRVKKPREVILSVLDDFERKVIEIITVAGGETNQRKVVNETNLSKAKVSRVVKRLQERGLIEVIRLGRTNKLKLVDKKFAGN